MVNILYDILEYVFIVLIILMLLFIIVTVIDLMLYHEVNIVGDVMYKYAVEEDGRMTMFIDGHPHLFNNTTTYYMVGIKTKDNETEVNVSRETFNQIKEGQTLIIQSKIGRGRID